MSSGPVGGYILFPPSLKRTDLITTILQAMELTPAEFEIGLPDEEGFPRTSEEGLPLRRVEPLEQAMTELAQGESGVIDGRGSRSAEIFWFEPLAESYPVINIRIDASAMMRFSSEEVETLVRHWLQLCEQGQAVFGYFCPFGFMFDREYLENKVLPAFQYETARQLLEATTPSWLIYLGPELAQRWRQEQMPVPSPLLVSQDLPSGAHFLRASKGVEEASLSVFRPW